MVIFNSYVELPEGIGFHWENLQETIVFTIKKKGVPVKNVPSNSMRLGRLLVLGRFSDC